MHPKVEALINATYHEQRSQEWLNLREGMLTASDAATALGQNPYQTPEDLWFRKVGRKKWEGNQATMHGTLLEPVARDLYDERTGRKTHEIGLVQHPVHRWLGGSPDGVTEDGFLIEIKCPMSRKIEPKVPKHYEAQIQLLLEILDIEECDFVQYRPEPFEFEVTRVSRSREWFATSLPIMKTFWDSVVEGRKKGFVCEVTDEPIKSLDPVVEDAPLCEVLEEGGSLDQV
jgi:putative phage-type endonuclease